MRHAIEEANEKIHELAKEDAAKAGMGTTLVAVTVVGYYAYVANVGDSRLYVSDEQRLVQITRDHSWIAEMVMRGELSKEEARNHPDKNIITRALGAVRRGGYRFLRCAAGGKESDFAVLRRTE